MGQIEKAELSLKVVLPRAVIERLHARSIREQHGSLAALVAAVLERAAKSEPSRGDSVARNR